MSQDSSDRAFFGIVISIESLKDIDGLGIELLFGPVAVLCRSFDSIYCSKGD